MEKNIVLLTQSRSGVTTLRGLHNLTAFLSLTTLLLGTTLAWAVDNTKNWVTNGNFAGPVVVSGENQRPANWECAPALSVKRLTDDKGAYFIQIQAKTPPAGGAYVIQTIPYAAPEGKPADFALTCDVKFNNCQPGPEAYMRARVLLLYTTADLVLRDQDYARYFKGDSDWQPVTIPCTFPADTKDIKIYLGFHTSSGTLCVRNVQLRRADLANLPKIIPGVVSTQVAPGVVETDYGVTKTLDVGDGLWYELPDHDAAAQWYKIPNSRGDYDPAFVRKNIFTDAEQSRGYVAYQRADTMVASADNYPERQEILSSGKPVRISLCAGETRSAVVSIYPFRELPSFKITFGDFASAAGDKIASNNLRADIVETLYCRANEFQQYVKMPRAIQRFESVNLPAENGTQFWIYCQIPEGTPAGVYQGNAQIVSAGIAIGNINFQIKIYPFKLLPTPVHWSMLYYYPPDQDLPADLKYMQSLGMNSVIYSPPATSIFDRLSLAADGKPVFDFTPDDEFMAAYKKAGYTKPVIYYPRLLLLRLVQLCAPDNTFPVEDFYGAKIPLVGSESEYPAAACETYKKVLRLIADHAKTASWPETIFYLTDEPFRLMWREAETAVSYRLAKEACPEIKTFCTVYDPILVKEYGKSIDYISSRGLQSAAPRPENQAMRDACAQGGSHLWACCWPPLYWHNYWYARAYAGFVCERSGFEGMNIWCFGKYGKDYTDRFKSLHPRGAEGGLSMTWSSKEGEPENHTVLEGLREGILDSRYIATLKNAFAEAEKAGRDVNAYKSEFAEMVASAPTLLADSNGGCWDRPGLSEAGTWSVEKNERLRERIAEMIIEISRTK